MVEGRTIVIGDVHGCLRELDALLDACHFEPGRDALVLVGDLVAKGPDSLGVVRRAQQLGARAVRGNHEHAVLRYRHAQREGHPVPDLKPTHREVAEQLGEQDWAWLESLPLWLRLPEHHALVVHAGLVPDVPLERQRGFDMLCMRTLRPDGTGSKHHEDGPPWARHWPGPDHVFFGHDAIRGLQRHPHATGLDTGCVYGGELTACVLPDHRLVQIPAAAIYREAG